jgi:hypothetical protein
MDVKDIAGFQLLCRSVFCLQTDFDITYDFWQSCCNNVICHIFKPKVAPIIALKSVIEVFGAFECIKHKVEFLLGKIGSIYAQSISS